MSSGVYSLHDYEWLTGYIVEHCRHHQVWRSIAYDASHNQRTNVKNVEKTAKDKRPLYFWNIKASTPQFVSNIKTFALDTEQRQIS